MMLTLNFYYKIADTAVFRPVLPAFVCRFCVAFCRIR